MNHAQTPPCGDAFGGCSTHGIHETYAHLPPYPPVLAGEAMILGSPPGGYAEAEASGVVPPELAAVFAWADGASLSVGSDGQADTGSCPYTGELAAAWLEGASESRDIDGDVYWDSCRLVD